MKVTSKGVWLGMIMLGLIAPASVFATNGYFLIGYGAKSRGMGGVGVAYPQDGLAAGFNPAGMIAVGSRFDLGAEFFSPERAVKHDSDRFPADEKSQGDLYLIPNLGGISMINSDLAWGVAVTGAGLGTEYNQKEADYFFNFQGKAKDKVGVSLNQMQILPSIAMNVGHDQTIGASLALGVQFFKAFGLQGFGELGYSNDPGKLTNNGWDSSYGYGLRLGWLGTFLNGTLNLGANYSSRVYMSKFEKYSGLFAEQGDFDIPENYAIGIAYKLTPTINVAFDIQQIKYSDIASVGNDGPLASDPDLFYPCGSDAPECKLGGDKGLGFGWTDQTVYKLGIDYKYSNSTTLRMGYNYGKSPIPEDQVLFNMLAPAVVEHHLTLGATFAADRGPVTRFLGGKDVEISVNYMHAFLNTVKGPTAFGPDPGVVVDGSNASIAMKQNALGISYGTTF